MTALTERPDVVVDAAGGDIGGAARWRAELDAYLAERPGRVAVVGRGRTITPQWLLRREWLAAGAPIVVAPNNVSFAASGRDRRVLLRNALHFLYPSEAHLLSRMPRSMRAQIPVVRRLLTRATAIVVPCTAMADRVIHHVPQVSRRIAVRPHPVTPVGSRCPGEDPFILVPVVPGPYKNLVEHLRLLVAAADRISHAAQIRVTADPTDLPEDLRTHRRIFPIGWVPHQDLAELWRTAAAAFYPSSVESFGYPLAEARAYGIPVLAPDTAQAREIAGAALRGYDSADGRTIEAALTGTTDPVTADPDPFDRVSYFNWLLNQSAATPRSVACGREHDMSG